MALPTPRLARTDEAAPVHRLLWACRDEIPLEESFRDDVTREWLVERCRRRRIWVVRDAGYVAGAAVLHHEAGARARVGDWAELKYLVVSPDYRRRGIARALLHHVMSRWSFLRAFANEANGPIRRLLSDEGFVPFGAVTMGGWIRYRWGRATSPAGAAAPPARAARRR